MSIEGLKEIRDLQKKRVASNAFSIEDMGKELDRLFYYEKEITILEFHKTNIKEKTNECNQCG